MNLTPQEFAHILKSARLLAADKQYPASVRRGAKKWLEYLESNFVVDGERVRKVKWRQ